MRELKDLTASDADLVTPMHEFEEAIRDLKADQDPRKVKQCISAQFNLFEALLKKHPNVTRQTFGAMCQETQSWPHTKVMDAAKSIYRFASDYPGIRHGGTPANQIREIDMRDMISILVVLSGFTPYFSNQIQSERIYLDQ